MRDVELQAMLERVDLPLPVEPTDAQLQDLFWGEASLRALDARRSSVLSPLHAEAQRHYNAGTDNHSLAVLRAKLDADQRREAVARQLVTGPVRRNPETPTAPADFWKRTCYRVQLQSGHEWFDCYDSTSSTRAGAEAYRDRLLRAQRHLVLRILEPTP